MDGHTHTRAHPHIHTLAIKIQGIEAIRFLVRKGARAHSLLFKLKTQGTLEDCCGIFVHCEDVFAMLGALKRKKAGQPIPRQNV